MSHSVSASEKCPTKATNKITLMALLRIIIFFITPLHWPWDTSSFNTIGDNQGEGGGGGGGGERLGKSDSAFREGRMHSIGSFMNGGNRLFFFFTFHLFVKYYYMFQGLPDIMPPQQSLYWGLFSLIYLTLRLM